ncbi:MAG: nitrogenase component 1 [Methanoregulaceae archaeon]|nr:nitrogenase component 1 [Methanoregulaceae archaeon]
MTECRAQVWPCAMTGAAACLAGFSGLGVIVHGSSGCFYYPASLLHRQLHGTCITGEEVVFGADERLRSVIRDLSGKFQKMAVVTTCVPALTGEDVREILDGYDLIIVEAPGFLGNFETGYRAALEALEPEVDQDASGVNIAGLSLADPFHAGNLMEAERILSMAGFQTGTRLCADSFSRLKDLSPFTISANPDLPSGPGTRTGEILGMAETEKTLDNMARYCDHVDVSPVIQEARDAEARIEKVSDAFLRRYDPPRVTIFGGASYATFAATLLRRYLDAEILLVCSRNEPPSGPYATCVSTDLDTIAGHIRSLEPDLIVGSSIERSISPEAAFVGITQPLRGSVRIRPRPIAGIQGALSFMEETLNACTDMRRKDRSSH